jgi:hypothetical protein
MKKLLYLLILSLGLVNTVHAQTIPKELWGTWIVRREVPTTTISCWGSKEAKKLIGTELEYSAQLFRWDKVATNNPTAETMTTTAQRFHDENSGGGAKDSQVTFLQLGIKEEKVDQIVIQHPAANVTRGTIEIPGDRVLIKNKNTIIFSVCNVYFEAKRRVAPR